MSKKESMKDNSGGRSFIEQAVGSTRAVPTTTTRTPPEEPRAKYADFRNGEWFPPFTELPEDNSIDLTFYGSVDGSMFRPTKHWCFLAEIVDVEQFVRLRLFVRDKSGHTIPIAFHTEERGAEFASTSLQPGYTVAVLYAHQHGFLDFTIGVRQEDYNAVKILPLRLNELLQMSDRISRYSSQIEGKRRCHGCEELKQSLQKCARCSLFWYCNKTCQTVAWTRDHKKDCKLLTDDDLRAMFHLDWNSFEDFTRYPMTLCSFAKTIVLRIPANGLAPELVSVKVKPRPHGDGDADFFDNVPDLSPWLRDTFKHRRVSDFHVSDVRDPRFQFSGFIKDNEASLHGRYMLYYTLAASLPINKCCTSYLGFDPPQDRSFFRGDLFVVRYSGELGMGHEYMDSSLRLARIVAEIVRNAYRRGALEEATNHRTRSNVQ